MILVLPQCDFGRRRGIPVSRPCARAFPGPDCLAGQHCSGLWNSCTEHLLVNSCLCYKENYIGGAMAQDLYGPLYERKVRDAEIVAFNETGKGAVYGGILRKDPLAAVP